MMTVEKLNYTKSLHELIGDLAVVDAAIEVSGIAIDSREIKPGDLFMAYRGSQVNGIEYIDTAIKAGAIAVAIDSNEEVEVSSVEIIKVPDLRKQVGLIASRFYNNPSKEMRIIGVTGTNGKTTVSWLIAQALSVCGQRSALIGTLGYGQFRKIEAGNMTTPDPIKLQSLFSSWRNEVDTVAMEVSSHALDQARVSGIDFQIGVFTNLSRDHLDYHDTLESYAKAKSQLFRVPGLKHAVINADDEYGIKLINELTGKVDLVVYSAKKKRQDLKESNNVRFVSCNINQLDQLRTELIIQSPWGQATINTSLLGQFNLENILAAFATLCLTGVAAEQAAKAISGFHGIPGRMETFSTKDKPLLVVDYAHTPDALEKSLKAVRPYCKGKLYCVFGCGGDRDAGKREQMGAIAEALSDHIVLTNDNPRSESPEAIIENILKGIKNKERVEIKLDRSDAITNTFLNADKDDIVLIAGKGHEMTQQIGTDLFPFSDRELARRLTEGDT